MESECLDEDDIMCLLHADITDEQAYDSEFRGDPDAEDAVPMNNQCPS